MLATCVQRGQERTGGSSREPCCTPIISQRVQSLLAGIQHSGIPGSSLLFGAGNNGRRLRGHNRAQVGYNRELAQTNGRDYGDI